jgi:hypothetical protein
MIEPCRPKPPEPRSLSKHADTLTLPLSLEAAVDACQAAFRAGNWKIMNTDGRNFLVKEQFGLVTMLFSYPSRAAILLRDVSETETRVELHGSIFGFGPLQSRRVRVALERLRADIERAANAVKADA